jgi:hypothetical protein
MAAKSGYERLAQVDEFDESIPPSMSNSRVTLSKSVAILSHPTHVHRLPTSSAPLDNSTTIGPRTRRRSNSGIDIKAINTRLERYAQPDLWILIVDG